jgi:outer membrane protein, multidrug efflux system
MRHRAMAVLVAMVLLTGCTLGPNYQRPAVAVPQSFHTPEPLPTAEAAVVGGSEVVAGVSRRGAATSHQNRARPELRPAGAVGRVEAAQANLGITRSDQFPQASASGDVNFTRLSRNGAFPLPASLVPSQNRNWGQAQLNLLSFEVDLWGRLRRATEAARANLLSEEENRKAVLTTLVGNVAAAILHSPRI